MLGLSIGLAKTTCMVSNRHCTFRECFVSGCRLMPPPHLSQEKPFTALPQLYLPLSALLLRIQPSPPLYAISASRFLIGNTLYCNVRRQQASKQARTLHVLQSNPFDLSSIVFSTHPAGLSVPLEQNNVQLRSVLRPVTCCAGGKRGKTLFFIFCCLPVRNIPNQWKPLVKGKLCSAGAKFCIAEPSRNAKR